MDNNTNINPKDPENTKNVIPFEIPPDGSLGLLALGHVGIKAWRTKREETKKSTKK